MLLRRSLVLLAFLALLAASCNLPFVGPLVSPNLIPTLVQQTMQALEAAAYSPTPTSTPAPSSTMTPATAPLLPLPTFPTLATPQVSIFNLSEPKNLHASCSSVADGSNKSTWTVSLRWTNTEPNQLGVRIYRNGRQIATLRAGARSYDEEFVHRGKGSVTYGVQAYNASSVSGIVTVDLRHCD